MERQLREDLSRERAVRLSHELSTRLRLLLRESSILDCEYVPLNFSPSEIHGSPAEHDSVVMADLQNQDLQPQMVGEEAEVAMSPAGSPIHVAIVQIESPHEDSTDSAPDHLKPASLSTVQIIHEKDPLVRGKRDYTGDSEDSQAPHTSDKQKQVSVVQIHYEKDLKPFPKKHGSSGTEDETEDAPSEGVAIRLKKNVSFVQIGNEPGTSRGIQIPSDADTGESVEQEPVLLSPPPPEVKEACERIRQATRLIANHTPKITAAFHTLVERTPHIRWHERSTNPYLVTTLSMFTITAVDVLMMKARAVPFSINSYKTKKDQILQALLRIVVILDVLNAEMRELRRTLPPSDAQENEENEADIKVSKEMEQTMEILDVVMTNVVNCRNYLHRARLDMNPPPRNPPEEPRQRTIMDNFALRPGLSVSSWKAKCTIILVAVFMILMLFAFVYLVDALNRSSTAKKQ